jgi:hypothetical protein
MKYALYLCVLDVNDTHTHTHTHTLLVLQSVEEKNWYISSIKNCGAEKAGLE